jgi:formylglycine-generating enzyme required for sulfatase activity
MNRSLGMVVCIWSVIAFSITLLGADPFKLVEKQGIRLVSIPAGQFVMGTSDVERERLEQKGWWNRFLESELPAHRVIIRQPFLIGQTEVTQAQWTEIMGEAHPDVAFKGEHRPVDSVSFRDVKRFLRKLNGKSEDHFRLPTEAEWEYCCRAGDWAGFMIGEKGQSLQEEDLADYCWLKGNSKGKTQVVGGRKPNGWGLHDMLGNVWEWCEDFYGRDVYRMRSNPTMSPFNGNRFPERVMRGGSWFLSESYQRAAVRSGFAEERRSPYIGFRLVCEQARKKGN